MQLDAEVYVAKPGFWEYDATFQGALGRQNVSQLEADDTNLNNGTVVVTTTTEGSTGPALVKTTVAELKAVLDARGLPPWQRMQWRMATSSRRLYRGHPFIRVPDVVPEASGHRVLTMAEKIDKRALIV